MTFAITEHTLKTARHTTGYLACGEKDAPLLIFVHGWPELSLSWRHQLPVFAALGFRCIAPDMRGYGRSSTYTRHQDFAQEEIVADMVELLAALGRDRAVWIGHDHVLAEMVRGLGGSAEPVTRPFRPEAGAYAGGHGHSPDHGHDHHGHLHAHHPHAHD